MKKPVSSGLRNALVSGMVVILPVWVTVLLIRALVRILHDAFSLLPDQLQPQALVPFQGIELITAFLVILVTGIAVNNLLGRKLMGWWESLVARIPVIKTVYQGVKHLTTGIVSDRKIFSRAVLISYPIPGVDFIGFVTGEETAPAPGDEAERRLRLFIPTTPNPTSGFFCLAPEKSVRPMDLSVEEAFRLIITAGYSGDSPGRNRDEPAAKGGAE